MKAKHIILGVTASIAIYKTCEIIRRLIKANLCLSVVMTKNATRLISPQVFSSLIGRQDDASVKNFGGGVYWDEFVSSAPWKIEHVSLAKRADLVLIVPATANIIGKIASGIADDLLTTTIIATRAPILIAPAMNENMYKNKIVQANIKKLKSDGFKFIAPEMGRLASGDIGIGHLAKAETIVKEVSRALLL